MKLLAQEFKETAKYFLPMWIISIIIYFISRNAPDFSYRNLYAFSGKPIYPFLQLVHPFLELSFSLFIAVFVFCAVVIPPATAAALFNSSVFSRKDFPQRKIISAPSEIIISKAFAAASWFLFVLIMLYNIYEPHLLDNMIHNPDRFADETYYLFNPFPGGFDIELIDFYAIQTVADLISIFLFLFIIFIVFFICICFSHIYFPYSSGVASFILIGISAFAIPYSLAVSSFFSSFTDEIFSRISELYSGVLSTCFAIVFEIIIAYALFFICRKLLEKALLKMDEDFG